MRFCNSALNRRFSNVYMFLAHQELLCLCLKPFFNGPIMIILHSPIKRGLPHQQMNHGRRPAFRLLVSSTICPFCSQQFQTRERVLNHSQSALQCRLLVAHASHQLENEVLAADCLEAQRHRDQRRLGFFRFGGRLAIRMR